MSDPYSALLSEPPAPAQEDDPYSKLLAEPEASASVAPQAAPIPDIYSLVPDDGASEPQTSTPSILQYPSSLLKGIPMGVKGNVAASLQGVAGWQADRPGYEPGQSPLDQAMRGDPQAFETHLQGPQGAPLPTQQHPLYQAGEALADFGKETLKPAPGTEFLFDVGVGGGSLVGNILTAAVLGPVGATLALFSAGSGEAAERAVKAGATPEQIARASRLGTTAGATEFVDIMLPKLGGVGQLAGLIGKVGAKVLIGAFAEGGQEYVQQVIQNLIAKGVYKPDQDVVEGAAYSGLIGAIVGGAAKPILDRRDPSPPQPATQEAVDDAYSGLVGSQIPGVTPPAAPAAAAPTTAGTAAPSVAEAPTATAAGSAIEQLLADPPKTPTEAHIRESAPMSGGADASLAEVAPLIMTPPEANPVRAKALAPQKTDDEILASVYEILGEDAKPKPGVKQIPINEVVEKIDFTFAPEAVEEEPLKVGTAFYTPPDAKPSQEPLDISKLKLVGPQLGSNKGGTYEDASGQRYYVKQPQTTKHVTNEKVAAALYKLAGASTLEYVPTDANHVATKQVKLIKNNASLLSSEERKQAQRDFAIHAWLANWDVVGLGGDNIGLYKGKPIALDLGGALEFRAQGQLKGDAFGSRVTELQSLRDPKINPDAAAIFGNMSISDVFASVQRIKALTNDQIWNAVLAAGGTAALANKLITRRDNMLSVETTPEAWNDALIESGESEQVSNAEFDELMTTEALVEPKLASTKNLFYKETKLIPLREAQKYENPESVRQEIIAHNKKISNEQKIVLKGSYFPMKVSTQAKKWILYHGSHSSTPFEKFKNPLDKPSEKGIFFTPSPSFAKNFSGGGVVYRAKINPGKTKVVDLVQELTKKKFREAVQKYNPYSDESYLNDLAKSAKKKLAAAKEERKAYFQKYGVPKLINPVKTGYDWGGIHTAIEMARKEGYDTIVLRNINEGGGHDQIVVITPNRVFNTKTKKMMFSFGGVKLDQTKLTPQAAAQRAELENGVVALLQQLQNAEIAKAAVRQVAGPGAAERTATSGRIQSSGYNAAWGGEVPQDVAGFYQPKAEKHLAFPLLAVATAGSTMRALITAYHESWHAIEGVLTSAEIAILRASTERLRAYVTRLNPADADLYTRAEPEEIWAEAAAMYAYEKTSAVAEMSGQPILRVLEKISQVIEAIRNFAGSLGFGRDRDIFEAFYAGEMASRREGLPTDMLERWWAREAGYAGGQEKLHAKLERNSKRNAAALGAVDPGITHVPAQMETIRLHDAVDALFSYTHGAQPPPQVQQALAHADVMAKRHKWMWGLDRLVDLNPRLTPLLRYAELIREMRLDATKLQDGAVAVAKRWHKLGKQTENLAQLIDYVANMQYRSPQEVQQGVARHPTPQEFQAAVQRFGVGNKALTVFNQQKQFFEIFLSHVTQNAIEEARRTISDPVALMNKIVAIQTQEANLLSRPYFPFLRFGSHYVMIKDANGDVVHFQTYERKGVRTAEMVQMADKKRLTGLLAPGQTITHGVLSESASPFIGLPPQLLESIQQQLIAIPNAAGQTPGLTAAQIRAIEELRYTMSPASSFAHRFQNKDYTPGYSQDFLRAFSRYAFNGSRYYSRVKYGWALRDHIEDTKRLGKQSSDNKIGAIANYMDDHLHNTVLDNKGDWGALKGGIFLWMFGFSVIGAAINFSQTLTHTYPFMAAKFGGIGLGDKRAAQAIAKAQLQLNNFYRKGFYKNHKQFEMKALNYAIETGRISESQAMELAGLAQGGTLLGLGNNKARRAAQKFMEIGTLMFETVEKYNRRVAFRAGLDLAQKFPNSKAVSEAANKYSDEIKQMVQSGSFTLPEAKTIAAAVHVVEQTQFVYATENRARFMRGRKGTFFVFKNYLLQTLQLMGANKGSVMPRQLILLLGLAGVMGLPGADDLEDLITAFGKLYFGKDFDFKRQLREWLVELSGEHADVVLHGMSRKGFGIPALVDMLGEAPGRGLGSGHSSNVPLPVLDVSRNLGMGSISPVRIGQLLDPLDINKAIAEETQRASGAVFGVGFNLFRALMDSSTEKSDFKRWERAMPRALGGASRAYRAYTEERERSRGGPNSGATVVRFDRDDAEHNAEIVAMALGFVPERVNRRWEQIVMQSEVEKRLAIQQGLVLRTLFEARQGGRDEDIERAIAKRDEFNEELPEWARGYRIGFQTESQSMEARAREKNLREAGIPTQRRNRPVADYIQSLFPGNVTDVRRVK